MKPDKSLAFLNAKHYYNVLPNPTRNRGSQPGLPRSVAVDVSFA